MLVSVHPIPLRHRLHSPGQKGRPSGIFCGMGMSIVEYVRLEAVEKLVAEVRARLDAAESQLATLPRCEPPAIYRAARFLERELEAGPVAFDQVVRRATEAGISPRTIRRAKARLGVRSIRTPKGADARYASWWALP